jgi:sugar phosphate isomerase/epimerase
MKTSMKFILLLMVASIAITTTYANEPNNESVSSTSPKLSIQLWSVRNHIAEDFNATIDALGKMGFEGVELAGDFGNFTDDPKGLAALIKSKGLKISGAHVDFNSLSDEKFEDTINFYKAADVPMLIIGYDTRAGNSDTIEQTIADLNRIAPMVEAHGMRFGYHNHDFEFAPFGDTTFWDHIAKSTPDSLVLQMDVGWVNHAGADPIEYVRRYPGRTLSTHYKIKFNNPIIGQDSFDWAALYKTNRDAGGTQWVVLEQEEYPEGLTPLESVRLSKQGLAKALISVSMSN